MGKVRFPAAGQTQLVPTPIHLLKYRDRKTEPCTGHSRGKPAGSTTDNGQIANILIFCEMDVHQIFA